MEKENKDIKIGHLYIVTLLLSLCSIVYELLIAQTVSSLTYNTVVWYSIIVGFYIGSMGIGALYLTKIFQKNNNLLHSLFVVEVLLTLFGLCCVAFVYFGHMLFVFFSQKGFYSFGFFIFLTVIISNVVIIGFLSGLELPLLIQIAENHSTKRRINRILAVDYFGALLGAVCFPLFFFPKFELITIAVLIAALNLFVAGILYFKCLTNRKWAPFSRVSFLGLIVIFVSAMCYRQDIQKYFLEKYYYYDGSSENIVELFSPVDSSYSLERYLSAYQKIDLVEVPEYPEPYKSLLNVYTKKLFEDTNFPKNYILFINGSFQFWSNFEEVYHEYFAHVPIQMNQSIPKNILVLGSGDGLLIRELLKYDSIEDITVVELDKKMVDLAKNHQKIVRMNKHAFSHSKVEVVIADAYYFLRNNKKKFDAIYIDFPAPNNYELSKLYSREFYSFVKKALKTEGFAVFDAPSAGGYHQIPGSNFDDWLVYKSTLKAAGFKTIIPFYSNLETDHPDARKILWDYLGDTQLMTITDFYPRKSVKTLQGKNKIIQRVLNYYPHPQRYFLKKLNKIVFHLRHTN